MNNQAALKRGQARRDNSVPSDYWDWNGDLTEKEKALLGRAEDSDELERITEDERNCN